MLVKFGRKREGGRGSSLLYCVRPDCMTKHKARTVFLPSTQLERITRPVILFSLRLPWLFFFLLKIFDLTYIPFLQQNNIGNGSLTLYSWTLENRRTAVHLSGFLFARVRSSSDFMEADAPPSGLCFGSRELPIEITSLWTMAELSDTCQDPLTSRTVNYQSDRDRERIPLILSRSICSSHLVVGSFFIMNLESSTRPRGVLVKSKDPRVSCTWSAFFFFLVINRSTATAYDVTNTQPVFSPHFPGPSVHIACDSAASSDCVWSEKCSRNNHRGNDECD